MEGMSGLTHNTGNPDEPPLLSGFAYGDWVTGAKCRHGAWMTATFPPEDDRQRTVCGCFRKRSHHLSPGRHSSRLHPEQARPDIAWAIGIRDVLRMAVTAARVMTSGWAIAIETDSQWRRSSGRFVNRRQLRDPAFASRQGRLARQPELDCLIEQWTCSAGQIRSIEHICQKFKIPAGPALSMKRNQPWILTS